jgi:pyruvate kinase
MSAIRARVTGGTVSMVARSLARVASTVAEELDCKLIVAFTESGITARLLSLHRPRVPVVAITHEDRVYRQLALAWGVVPIKSEFVENSDELLAAGGRRQRRAASPRAARSDARPSPAAAAANVAVHTVS